jgi:hypothetical protein
MVNTRVFLFFFLPFFGGFVVYGRTDLCIFQMALLKVNTKVLLLLLLLFPPLTDGPTHAITFKKIKNMTNLVKQCRDASLWPKVAGTH